MSIYRKVGKRIFDVGVAGLGLVLLSPIMLLTALAIKLDDGGPVLFKQQRIGRRGVPFTILKFRSMPVHTKDIPKASANLPITRVGRVIRRLNIDELPQLVNVLKGDMSIVGPRPALPVQTELLSQRSRNGAMACRPGLTGLAQVNSYDGMSETEKARWDGLYASSVSPWADLQIILKTFAYLTKPPPVY